MQLNLSEQEVEELREILGIARMHTVLPHWAILGEDKLSEVRRLIKKWQERLKK